MGKYEIQNLIFNKMGRGGVSREKKLQGIYAWICEKQVNKNDVFTEREERKK